jgi:hypothetical protein
VEGKGDAERKTHSSHGDGVGAMIDCGSRGDGYESKLYGGECRFSILVFERKENLSPEMSMMGTDLRNLVGEVVVSSVRKGGRGRRRT